MSDSVDNSSAPKTENRVATIINKALSALINDAGEAEVEALIIAAAPAFFAIPIIGWISRQFVHLIVSKFAWAFYEVAAKLATRIVVNIQANMENSDVKDKGSKLEDAIKSGDENAIAKADQDLEDSWGNLIHMDGAAPP